MYSSHTLNRVVLSGLLLFTDIVGIYVCILCQRSTIFTNLISIHIHITLQSQQ